MGIGGKTPQLFMFLYSITENGSWNGMAENGSGNGIYRL